MGPSIGVTHGTATKMNATGKAKWRSHEAAAGPPTHQRYKRDSVTTDAVWSQAIGRHSGLAISKRRTVRSNRSAARPTSTAIIAAARLFRIWDLGLGISGGGRSCQRSQKR